MSTIRFRPPTEAELEGVRSQWLSQVLPRPDKNGRRADHHPAGRSGATLSTWGVREAIEAFVEQRLRLDRVIVAELETAPGEILGWVSCSDEAIHFVRVPAGYGRRGLGGALLLQAGVSPAPKACTWLTPNGRALLAALDKPR